MGNFHLKLKLYHLLGTRRGLFHSFSDVPSKQICRIGLPGLSKAIFENVHKKLKKKQIKNSCKLPQIFGNSLHA